MRAYVLVTGLLFVALTVAHLLRLRVEPHVVHDPWFVFSTLLAAGMGVWAWRVLRLWPWRSTE